MTVKLKGHGTKIKFMTAHRGLRGKNIYINKDLTKDTHDFLLQIKKDCVEGVAVYIVDGCVLIWPVSRTQERFIVLWRVMTLNVMVWNVSQYSPVLRLVVCSLLLSYIKWSKAGCCVQSFLYQRTAHRFTMCQILKNKSVSYFCRLSWVLQCFFCGVIFWKLMVLGNLT